MPLEPPVGGSWQHWLIWRGLGSLHHPIYLLLVPGSLHEWTITNKMFRATAVIAALFIKSGHLLLL